MEYVMNRNVTVSSTFGHTIKFVKDQPQYVPPALRTLVQERGGLPVDGAEPVHEAEAAPLPVAPMGEERVEKIKAAMLLMVERNARGDFGANGRPNVRAVEKEIGFDIDAKERDAAWDGIMVEGAE